MTSDNKKKVNELLKDRPDLICDLVYHKSIENVKTMLALKEWEDPKIATLLTPSIWIRKTEEVKKILQLKEWEDPKFTGLLTPSIWLRKAEEVKEIIELKEWEDQKFAGLLTASIWQSNVEEVKEKLKLEYWQDEKYQHLLTPTIFAITNKNIEEGIALFEKYKIEEYITTNSLRRNQEEQRLLIKYMVDKKIDLIVDDARKGKKLNPILNCSNRMLKRNYQIDIKELKKGKEEEERYI